MKATLYLALVLSFFYSKSQATDEDQIAKCIEGYITNFFLNDYSKMEVNLHERLSKRGVNQDGKLSEDYSKSDLKELMQTKPALPFEIQKNTISNIEVSNRVATAILDTGYPRTRWKEYIQLAKLDGNWIIMDVLWCFEKIDDQ
ncbi:MAG: nuclear transport factor 2 family protein [Ekhidna sp.]|nr:nuclear transport factor 2 family protein [Ekhidna sp.]